MTRRSMLATLAVLAVLALPAGLHAQGAPGAGPEPPRHGGPPPPDGPGGPRGDWGPPPGVGMPGMRMPPPEALEQLGLSEAQRSKIDDVIDGDRRASIRGDGDVRIAELDLQKLLDSDPPDATGIARAIEHLMALRRDMLKARVAAILELRAVLTAEQRARLRRPPSDSPWH